MILVHQRTAQRTQVGFRLLNSEIGNDLKFKNSKYDIYIGFRLLNSEIGNDRIRRNIFRII